MYKEEEIRDLVEELNIKEDERQILSKQISTIKMKITSRSKAIIKNYVYGKYNKKILEKDDILDIREYIENLKGNKNYEKFSTLLKDGDIKYFIYFNRGEYPLFYITDGKGKYQIIKESTEEVIYEGFAEKSYTETWLQDYRGNNEELNKVCAELSAMDDWIFKEI